MSGAYERRLEEFIEGKIFTRLSRPVRNRADAHCDACGSLEPRILFGLKEKESDRYFFVGAECLRRISRRGSVERRFCKESAQVALEHEMAKRRCEEGHMTMAMSIEALRTLVQQASHTNPHLTSRLEKAAFLLLLRPVVEVGQDCYRVMSEDGLRWYEIQNGQCECSDYSRHGPDHPCKHRLAVALLQILRNGD